MRGGVFVAFLVVVAACVACSERRPPTKPASAAPAPAAAPAAGEAEVKALADRLLAAAMPCNTGPVAALFDREAFLRLIEKRAPAESKTLRTVELFTSTAANKLCAWIGEPRELRVLRIRSIDGEQRPVLRKVSTISIGYFDVRVTSGAQGTRLLDIYSHSNGTWISEEIADTLLVPGSGDRGAAMAVVQINMLQEQGRHAEALAILDALPEPTRNTRVMQSLRVAIAGQISVEAYEQAIAERMRRLPGFKPSPLQAMNRAFLAGDLAEALRQIDLLDAAVGGDPLLDAIRALVLVQRNRSGDLEAAAARAERAVRAEPKLTLPHTAKLTVALSRRDWTTALATLEALARDLGVTMLEGELRTLPNAAELIASPGYAEWRERHPQPE